MIEPEGSLDFGSLSEPWVIIGRSSDDGLHDAVDALTYGGIVRNLSSRRMLTPGNLFAEFAKELEFPSYFGRNWDALVDCLDDLHGSWHGNRPVLVVVDGADELVDAPFFPLFVVVLCEAAEKANLSLDADGVPRDQAPFPLHFVFFVNDRALGEVADMLRQGRDDLRVVEAAGRLLVSWVAENS